MDELPRRAEIIARKIELGGLYEYTKAFWSQMEPGSRYVDNWHIGAMCDFAEAAICRRDVKRGVVNVPPRMCKSTIFSVAAQAYQWALHPEHRFMAGSYDQGLVERDAQRILDVVQCPLHQMIFPGLQLAGVQALKRLKTTAGGRRVGTTPRARGGTGWGAHTQVVDDPINVQRATSEKELTFVANWFTQTMANRIDGDPEDFVRLVVMQRLHADDLAGICIEMGYTPLILPMGERDSKGRWTRLLFPELWPAAAVEKMASDMKSPAAVAGQLLQDPTPMTGGFCEDAWIIAYDSLPAAPQLLRWFQIWDLNFKGKKESHSRVAGGLFFEWQGEVWLHDYFAEHINYPASRKKIVSLHDEEHWGRAGRIYVEDAANGPAIIADFRDADRDAYRPEVVEKMQAVASKMVPFTAGAVRGHSGAFSKEERFTLQADKIRAGKLRMRRGLVEPKAELVGFPNTRYNDLADIVIKSLELQDSRGLLKKSAVMQKILGGKR